VCDQREWSGLKENKNKNKNSNQIINEKRTMVDEMKR